MKAVYNNVGVRVPGMYEMGGATDCEINDTFSGTDVSNDWPKKKRKCGNSRIKGGGKYKSPKRRARDARRG